MYFLQKKNSRWRRIGSSSCELIFFFVILLFQETINDVFYIQEFNVEREIVKDTNIQVPNWILNEELENTIRNGS